MTYTSFQEPMALAYSCTFGYLVNDVREDMILLFTFGQFILASVGDQHTHVKFSPWFGRSGPGKNTLLGLISWELSAVALLSPGDVDLMAVAPDRPLGQIEYSLVSY